jgi:N utilization substance protein A
MVVNELRGEKVDIVPYSTDPAEFVMKALSPAKVKEVHVDHQTATAEVVVPDYQLSVAIGKEGQNARLAARLTGWRVDIKSESQLMEEAARADEEWAAGEWVQGEGGELLWQPAEGGEAVSAEAAGWGEMGQPAPEPAAETVAAEAAGESAAEAAGEHVAEAAVETPADVPEVSIEAAEPAEVAAESAEPSGEPVGAERDE